MILVGFSISNVLIVTLSVTLGLLILFILYRKILAYVSRGEPIQKDYAILYPVEQNPASGEVTIYFTCEIEKDVVIELLDSNMVFIQELFSKRCQEGGQIVRFDSRSFTDGEYFYCLKSENQKTMKKIIFVNEIDKLG
jgi:hypothetical protein